MKKSIKHHALLVAFSSILAVSSANAANTFYTPGDLVLYFQQEGGTNVVYANLGNAATQFRGAATGPDAANKIQFLDLNSTLTSAFGSGWATNITVYAGLAGSWSTGTANTLQDLDPQRTVYLSAARGSVGTIGIADSSGYYPGFTALGTIATQIDQQNRAFADLSGTNGYNASVIISTTDISMIDENNPFSAVNTLGNAFNNQIAGGAMQEASAAGFGAIDGVGATAFALDLYRMQGKSTVAGQVGLGETARLGTFEGTVAIGTDGQVSFMTSPVPEPSALTLSSLAAGALVLRRRRRSA